MNDWIQIILPSAAFGVLCALFPWKQISKILSGVIPLLLVILLVLYQTYLSPYEGQDPLWPTAIVFGGTAAYYSGLLSFMAAKYIFEKKPPS